MYEYYRQILIIKCANYMIEYGWSVRRIAGNLGIGKSTVHNFLTIDLPRLDYEKYVQCQVIMRKHKKGR